jgi:hypothetical protein
MIHHATLARAHGKGTELVLAAAKKNTGIFRSIPRVT